jgi:hypothetical protein
VEFLLGLPSHWPGFKVHYRHRETVCCIAVAPLGPDTTPAFDIARVASKGDLLAKPNYQFEKRQRDLAKKQKQEEKRRQKLADKASPSGPDSAAVIRPDDATTPES